MFKAMQHTMYHDDGDEDDDEDEEDEEDEEEEEERRGSKLPMMILELMIDIRNITSWGWNTEEEDPIPAGNQ